MKRNYLGVQALRGFGALLVVLFHVMVMVRAKFDPDSWLFTAGAAGVDLFFAISGFIMVIATQDAWGQPGVARDFLKRRLIRIVPIYWLMTSLKLLALLLAGKLLFDGWYILTSYLFIPAWSADHHPVPILAPGWTLFFEMFFYLLFALMLWLRQSPLVPLTVIFAALALIGVLCAPFDDAIFTLLDQRLLEFVIGMWIGKLTLSGRVLPSAIAWVTVIISLSVILASNGFSSTLTTGYPLLIWGIPSALLLYAVVSLEQLAVWKTRLPLALGDASYAIYLSHEFVISAVKLAIQKLHLTGSLMIATAIVLSLVASSVAGIAIHRGLEKPVIRYLRRSYIRPD